MMQNTKLILLEGLPGTGKSTKCHFLSMQLGREGKPARWMHEVARPHPVLFFDEASLTHAEYHSFLQEYPQCEPILKRMAVFRKETVGIDLLELEWNALHKIGERAIQTLRQYDVWNFPLEKYADVATEKWSYFAQNALQGDAIYILDSSIFQYQIFTYLLKNEQRQLEWFIPRLMEILAPLNPNLIYLYRQNARDTISFLEKLRGTQAMQNTWERDKAHPYYSDKPQGVEGNKRFLMDYAAIAQQLFDRVGCRKTAIEISKEDWGASEDAILAFLGAQRKVYPYALAPSGIFRNEALAQEFEIHDRWMKDPYGKQRALTPKSNNEFYVECLPVVLHYHGPDQIRISGEQICERWTTTGTRFIRI